MPGGEHVALLNSLECDALLLGCQARERFAESRTRLELDAVETSRKELGFIAEIVFEEFSADNRKRLLRRRREIHRQGSGSQQQIEGFANSLNLVFSRKGAKRKDFLDNAAALCAFAPLREKSFPPT